MSATNRYMNYGVFSFGGTAVTGIKSFNVNYGISIKQESGDNDAGPTVSVQDYINPSFTFTTLDAMALTGAIGTLGIFIATLLDATNKNATGGGKKLFTTNALSFIMNAAPSSAYREFATDTITIGTTFADGVTNPLTVSSP